MPKKNLLDVLLFPKSFFKKISGRPSTLYPGIFLIGLTDMGLFLNKRLMVYFSGKDTGTLIFNISLMLVFIVLIGLMDIAFFSLPLIDIFKFFRVEKRVENFNTQRIKLMKIYIVSHLPVVPVSIFLHLILEAPYAAEGLVYAIVTIALLLAVPIWHAYIIARGANVIYSFDKRLKDPVFVIVYLWTLLLGSALGYIIENWLIVFLM